MEELNLTGQWWDPKSPETKWTGTLVFSPNGTKELTISGAKDTIDFKTSNNVEVLVGRTGGKGAGFYSAINCSVIHTTHSSDTGIKILRLNIGYVLKNLWVENPETLIVDSIWADFYGMTDFLWNRNTADDADPESLSKNFQINNNLSCTIRFYRNRNFPSALEFGHSVHYETYMSLKAETPISISEVYETIKCIESFFSIIFQRFSHCKSLSFTPSPNQKGMSIRGKSAQCFFPQRLKQPETNRGYVPFIDHFFNNDDNNKDLAIESLLSNWFSNYDMLTVPVSLYMLSCYHDRNLDDKFLSLCQSAEAYFRNFEKRHVFDPQQYETEILPHILDSLPDTIPGIPNKKAKWLLSNIRSSIKGHTNSRPFSAQIQKLIAITKEATSGFSFSRNPVSVSKSITNDRNYYVHRDGGSCNEPEVIDLLRNRNRLKIIMESLFLTKMNVDQNTIDHAFSKSNNIANLKNQKLF